MLSFFKIYPDCWNCELRRCKELQKDIKELKQAYKYFTYDCHIECDDLYIKIQDMQEEYNQILKACLKLNS